MKETSKAMMRRGIEDRNGFPWSSKIFVGAGIDIGCGDDKLPFEGCDGFDIQDGDANHLYHYRDQDSVDYIHSSQSLEHMREPITALAGWLTVVKPGGYVVVTVPDWCLYEKMQWPSNFNSDHKSTWSLWLPGSPAPHHILVPDMLTSLAGSCRILKCALVDTNYDYKLPAYIDQTLGNAEAFIEFVLEKNG